MGKISVISGKSSEDLARKLSRKIKANLVKSEVRIFPDGESKITLSGNISKRKSIVVQSIYPPVDTNLVQALSLISKAKEISSEVIAVIPYMGYARQDREFLPGEIVTMKVLANLFKGVGASKIIAVDIHSKMGLKHFTIKSKNVTAIPDLVKYFKKLSLKNPLIVSPDQGGKDKKQKCKRVYVACTHALLINDAEKKIKKAGVTSIVSTNTIPGKTSVVDVSSTIAKAIM